MNIRRYLSNLADADDLLGIVGLKRRSSLDFLAPLLLGAGAGLAIGSGLALLLTPYRGDEIRSRVRRGATDAQRRLSERADELGQKLGLTEQAKPPLSTGSAGSIGSASSASKTDGAVATSRPVGLGGASPGSSGTGGNRGG